jgi:hypothetical protein
MLVAESLLYPVIFLWQLTRISENVNICDSQSLNMELWDTFFDILRIVLALLFWSSRAKRCLGS